jgi:transposase-like protein
MSAKEVQVLSGKMKLVSNDETKRRIVKEHLESGLSLNRFAKERGLSPATLCSWKKKYAAETVMPSSNDIDSLREENERLKRELIKIKAYLGHKIFEFEGAQIA